MQKILVNAIGKPCPAPVVMATRALRGMREPGTLEILVNDTVAVQNLTRMAGGHHLSVKTQALPGGNFSVVMDVQTLPESVSEPEPACSTGGSRSGLVVAVDSDTMGHGDDTLGRTLLKGFLYALSQLPQPPETILFYNGGAHLTTEGSESLEDLRNLEARGTKILTCGTCLNYYGLTDRLAVGSVTNLYAIVETLAGAARIIKP
jgi:selenium metabolism protein YedF